MSHFQSVNRTVDFPVSFDWFTHKTHAFKPREISEDARWTTTYAFLNSDAAFQHLLRQCKKSWLVAVTFGQDTVALRLFDPAVVDDPSTRPISASINRERTVCVEVSRDGRTRRMDIKPVDVERAERAYHTGAFLHSARCLRPEEVALLDNVQASVSVAHG